MSAKRAIVSSTSKARPAMLIHRRASTKRSIVSSRTEASTVIRLVVTRFPGEAMQSGGVAGARVVDVACVGEVVVLDRHLELVGNGLCRGPHGVAAGIELDAVGVGVPRGHEVCQGSVVDVACSRSRCK